MDTVFDAERKSAGEKVQELQDELSKVTQKEAELKSKLKEGDPETPELVKFAADKKVIEERIKGIKPDNSKSLEQYKAFANEYSGYAEGWRASLMSVNILTDMKKSKEAEALLEPVIKESTSLRFYQTQVRLLYVSLLEENGKYDQALKEIDLLLSIAGDDKDLEAKGLLAKGRVLLLNSKKKEAFQAFDTLITKYESSVEARKAMAIKSL